jgi:WD40 repeat protein
MSAACREGYIFGSGTKGAGYYRKDVARLHHAIATAHAELSHRLGEGTGEDGEAGEVQRRQAYLQQLLHSPPSMRSMVISTDGTLLFTSSLGPEDYSIRVWRLAPTASPRGPELLRALHGHSAPVLSLALSPDGRLLFGGGHDGSVCVWSTEDWACMKTLKGHSGGVRALVLSRDGATLYTAAGDNTIRVR